MHWKSILQEESDMKEVHNVPPSFISGHPIGIIAIELVYPKLPGNVVNATTFPFPVLYQKVTFDIELLFKGDPSIEAEIIAAAKELEKQGVRAIVGACGYFAYFQKAVSEAVDIPVFLSSLSQVQIIKLGLKPSQKVAVLVASGENAVASLFNSAGADINDCIIQDIGILESFAPIRWGKTSLDNAALTRDLAESAKRLVQANPDIGAILLECSDLPPYACEIQRVTGLPVFDFTTLIKWVYSAVVQKRYYGYF